MFNGEMAQAPTRKRVYAMLSRLTANFHLDAKAKRDIRRLARSDEKARMAIPVFDAGKHRRLHDIILD